MGVVFIFIALGEIAMDQQTITIVLSNELTGEVRSRDDAGNLSGVAIRDLARLYSMYRLALEDTGLTVAEALVICEALTDREMQPDSAADLWAVVEEACAKDGLHTDWELEDYGPLVKKLKSLSSLHCMAIVDAAERFWLSSDYGGGGIYGIASRLFCCPEPVCPWSLPE